LDWLPPARRGLPSAERVLHDGGAVVPASWWLEGRRGRARALPRFDFAARVLPHFVDLIAQRAHERLLRRANLLAELPTPAHFPCLDEQAARSVTLADPRAAKRPTRSRGQIHTKAKAARFAECVLQQLHPLV